MVAGYNSNFRFIVFFTILYNNHANNLFKSHLATSLYKFVVYKSLGSCNYVGLQAGLEIILEN